MTARKNKNKLAMEVVSTLVFIIGVSASWSLISYLISERSDVANWLGLILLIVVCGLIFKLFPLTGGHKWLKKYFNS